MSNVKASATVVVTLEVDVGDSWGEHCTVLQVHDQAVNVAKQQLSTGLASGAMKGRWRIVGQPKVLQVLAEVVK